MNASMKTSLLAVMLIICATAARADSLDLVQAQGSFLANQTEMTFQVSYEVDPTSGALIPNSLAYTTTGFGPFTYRAGAVSLIDANGDILDISGLDSIPNDPYRMVLIYQTGLYLGSTELFTDYFCRSDCSITVTDPPPVNTPEPNTAFLLVGPLLALLGFRRYSPRASQ